MEKRALIYPYISLALIALAGAGVLFLTSQKKVQAYNAVVTTFPDTLGKWVKSEDIKFSDRIITALRTKDVMGRMYQNDKGDTLELIVVSANNNRSAFHPPEYCMTGTGAKLLEQRVTVSGNTLQGMQFSINEMVFQTDKGRKFVVWNWYCAGKTMTPNFYMQQYRLIRDEILKGSGKGMVVNLYAFPKDDDMARARACAADFTDSLLPVLEKYIQD